MIPPKPTADHGAPRPSNSADALQHGQGNLDFAQLQSHARQLQADLEAIRAELALMKSMHPLATQCEPIDQLCD